MSGRKPSALPDITDEDFRRRLDPLAQAVVPGAAPARRTERVAAQNDDNSESDIRTPSEAGEGRWLNISPDNRISGSPAAISRSQPTPSDLPTSPSRLADRIAAITHQEEVRAARGPKKGVEFLLPERVVAALRLAAAQERTSMTVKVLEALKLAGYPISDADFVDLRRLPKR
jgi:hypothetical protein